MADEKQAPKFVNVELVAVRPGFFGNALRHIGARFRFTGNVLPKWAVPAEEAAKSKPEKAKPLNGDTKPDDAQAAVKAKAAGASGGPA